MHNAKLNVWSAPVKDNKMKLFVRFEGGWHQVYGHACETVEDKEKYSKMLDGMNVSYKWEE